RHNKPVQARTHVMTTAQEVTSQTVRNIKRLTDSKNSIENFNRENDGVLISNMEDGKNMGEIVAHFAKRLALVQQAIDTNLYWSNIPYIFQTSSEDTRLSIEKMFSDIENGKPFIILDKALLHDNKVRTGVPSGINFIVDKLHDAKN